MLLDTSPLRERKKVLEISEIRLFDLMAERLFLDPIGYGNELTMWLFG